MNTVIKLKNMTTEKEVHLYTSHLETIKDILEKDLDVIPKDSQENYNIKCFLSALRDIL